MSKTNGNLVGVQEKREIAKIIDQEYQRKIETLQQNIRYTEGDILEEAKNKFGIQMINQKIEHLKEQIDLLEKKKQEFGFDKYDGFDTAWDRSLGNSGVGEQKVKRATKAGRFYYTRMSNHADVEGLRVNRDDLLKKLWVSSDREEIKRLSKEKITVKLLPKL